MDLMLLAVLVAAQFVTTGWVLLSAKRTSRAAKRARAETLTPILTRIGYLEEELLALRIRTHTLEGSVIPRERDVLELLTKLQSKMGIE